MRVWHSVSADFDDPNLLGTAGLVPALALAERAGLHRLVTEHVSVPGLAGSNAAVKVTAVVAGMVAGADSFEDLDLLRHGAMGRVFTGLRAPTTLGTHLRAYAFGHVRQLDAVASRVLGNLAAAVPRLLAGAEQVAYLDVDDTVRATHGYAKQGAAYGYSRVKGLNAQLATLSTPAAAPVIAGTRLRRGNVASAHGAARLISDALTTARRAGVTGTVTVRADSAYYARAVIAAARRGRARFWRDRTEQPCGLQGDRGHRPGRMDPDPLPERGLGRSRAAAGLRRRGRRGRVHRVHLPAPRRAGHRPADRAPGPPAQPDTVTSGQGKLFGAHRHHAVFTDSQLSMLDAEATHRDHAIVEQVIADLKSSALAHLPSVGSPPTPPGPCSPRSRSTSPAPPARRPQPSTPRPGPRPSAGS
jgi:hypothetical protein